MKQHSAVAYGQNDAYGREVDPWAVAFGVIGVSDFCRYFEYRAHKSHPSRNSGK